MRKVISFLLSIVMLFCFAACGDPVNQDNPDANPEITEPAGPVTDATQDDLATTDEQEREEATSSSFAVGEVNEYTYKNEFIGIACELDNNWTFYNEDQIREMNNVTVEMAGEEYENLLQSSRIIYDMMAINSNQLDNINVTLEKVSSVLLENLDLAQYLENSIEMSKLALENMGYTNIQSEIGTTEIDGETFTSMQNTASMGGITMYQTCVVMTCDGYIASIIATSYTEGGDLDILDNLYLLD